MTLRTASKRNEGLNDANKATGKGIEIAARANDQLMLVDSMLSLARFSHRHYHLEQDRELLAWLQSWHQ